MANQTPAAGRGLAAAACVLLVVLSGSDAAYAEGEKGSSEKIDASDPTRIYTYVGVGPKYHDYTNGEHLLELRVSGNLGLSKKDMVFFNAGYGHHSGDKVAGGNDGLTNARARWFHLAEMDYSVASGYRGWATQVDLQLAGRLKGTDGQNVLSLGALPAFGLNRNWSLYLPMNVLNSWDKRFGAYNGMGLNVSPLLVYTADSWWDGAYVQFWGGYTRFVSGDLSGEGAGNLDITIGGKISPTVTWTLVAQKNVDVDLQSYRRDENSGLKNDWNAFLFFTTYF